MNKRTIRVVMMVLFMAVGAIGTTYLGKKYIEVLSRSQGAAGVPDAAKLPATLTFSLVGVLIGVLIWTFLYYQLHRLRRSLETMSAVDKIYGGVGIIVGMLLTGLIISSFRLPTWAGIVTAIVLCYMCIVAALSMKEQIRIPTSASPGKSGASNVLRPKILDTNVIIDGRIADICKAGFVEGPIYVPRFVLEELQLIADASDPLKRARGRRGLDILNSMQQEVSLQIQTYDSENHSSRPEDVDGKLIELANELDAALVTNDYNLNKVAILHGIRVLNVNELANALKPVVLPGEEMVITIIKEGTEPNQGIGYLEDGTMVVVQDGRKRIGETVDVSVTNVRQTAAGKMIFTNMSEDRKDEDGPIDRDVRNYSSGRPRKKIR